MKTMFCAVAACVVFSIAGTSWGSVWYVNDDAAPGGSGLAWESALQTIGSAVAAADIYDEIWVAQGTYSVAELKYGQQLYGGFVGTELNRLSRAAEYYATVTRVVLPDDSRVDGFNLEGNSSNDILLVEGQRSCVTNCTISTTHTALHAFKSQFLLENCTFTKTGEDSLQNLDVGWSDVSLIRCTFYNSPCWFGYSSVEGFGCTFINSTLRGRFDETIDFMESYFVGGAYWGVECYGDDYVSFVRCCFANNQSGYLGSAISAQGITRMVVEDCIFSANEAQEAGAAIFFGPQDGPSTGINQLSVVGSQFTGNTSGVGGAIYINQAWANLEKCTFTANMASTGACVHSSQSSLTAANCLFAHNTADNTGGAFFLDAQSELDMRNCTIWECNSELGAAVQTDHGSEAAITNAIVWQCLPAALAASGVTARIDTSYSCIEGGAPGSGNVDKNPWFADPDNDDFSLLWASPCIDSGTSNGAPADDLAGTARPQLMGIDMGAFEFVITDEDEDGMDDVWEVYYGLDPADPADADEDADGDGVTNVQEAAIRNNPQDPDDCRDTYYVATSGSDADGDGSETDPWATIGKAMAYAGGFSAYKDVTINVDAGTYVEPVTFHPNITLTGAGAAETKIEYFDISEDEHFVVVGADGAKLNDCTVRVSGQYSASFALLKLDDVSMEIENVTFDGDDNLYSLGALISGTGSSATVIDGCTFRRLYFGVQAVNTAANVTNTTFSGIRGDAVFVRLPDVRKYGEPVCTPLLGDAANADTTGNNMFRNVMGNFVLNMNNVTTKAENNDWGLYKESEIAAKMAGPVDYTPFVGEQADDGDNGGCFATADKALPMRARRSGADTFIMIGIGAGLIAGSRRKKH